MSVLKVQCPECDAKLRLDVDGDGDHEVECPKCGHEFTATLGDEDAPAQKEQIKKPKKSNEDEDDEGEKKLKKGTKETTKTKDTKSKKAAKRDEDDEEEDEDDAPKKKKKKKKGGDETDDGKKKLVIAGAVVGLLLLLGVGGIIFALTRGDKTAKNTDPPPAPGTPPQGVQLPGPGLGPGPGPGPGPNPGPAPKPKDNPNPNPGPGPKPPDPGPGPMPGPGPAPKPKDKNPDDEELATSLPPPPKIRISGSAVPTGKPIVKPPAVPPLAPDEDPFVRAQTFRPEGKLPDLPKLPPAAQRPSLTLDAGGHTAFVRGVFFTPKGDRIVTIGEDKAVRVCDVATGDTVRTIRLPSGPGEEGSLKVGALAPNGRTFAVAGVPIRPKSDTMPTSVPIFLVNIETGVLEKTISVPRPPKDELEQYAIDMLDFSRSGNELAVGCWDGTALLYKITVTPAQVLGRLEEAHRGGFRDMRYNPDPKKSVLATLGYDNTVRIWDFKNTKNNFGVRIGGGVKPTCLDWSSDGRTLAVGSTNGEIMLSTADGNLIRTFKSRDYNGALLQIFRLRYAPGDRELIACGVGGGNKPGWAGVIDADTGAFKVDCTEHTNTAGAVNVSPDGTRAVSSGGNQNETLVWDTANGKVVRKFVSSGAGNWVVGWAKDGKSLAWGTEPPMATNTNGIGKLEGVFRLDEFGVGDAPDPAKYAQAVDGDDTVQIKRFGQQRIGIATAGRDPELVKLPKGERVYSASVLPRGNAIIVGGAKSLYLVNPANLTIIKEFVGHTGHILSVAPSPDGRYFVSGSSDQTIRIWRRDQEDPIMSIFVAGREWIAWTPQGYYACSSQGEKLIAWQVNAGTRLPLVHPAARFRPSMYQPAILKYLIPAGDMPRALAMAQKFDKALVATTSVADVLPPEVVLEGFGEAEVKVDKNTVTVKATATSAKHPITAMRLLVNGRPFQGTAGVKKFDNPQKTAEAIWEVPVVPGTHTFAVIADSPVSKGMSKVGIAFRPGEPPKPNLYVLAMGVSDYPGDMKLNYCATDAQMLADAFPKYGKNVFAKIEVKLLTDKQATKKGILDGLDWLKSKMTPQDVGVVSFSGHGMRDPFGRFYLVPADVNENDPAGSCLPGDVFKDRLDNMPGRLVAILDACHSGTVAEKAPPPAQADTLVRDLTAEDSGVIVMCASLGREYAIESKLSKAGFFTLGLVEGMAGHGDVDGDGVVYIHELDLYANARVRQLSGGRQNPTLGRPPSVRPFPIAKPDNPPK